MAIRDRHIEVFRTIMIAGSVTAAAIRLCVSQPAVSQTLSDMEKEVGFRLFDRVSGRLRPTSRADLLYREIERSFIGISYLNAFCKRLREMPYQAIPIASIPTISLSVIPYAIKKYTSSHQGIFFLHSRISERVIEWVSSHKADAGLTINTPSILGLKRTQLASLRALCAIPSGHPLAAKESIDVSDLHEQCFITLASAEGISDKVELLCEGRDVKPNVVAECPMATAACAMAAEDLGIVVLDPISAFLHKDKNVVFRPFRPLVPIDVFCYQSDSRDPPWDVLSFQTFVCDRLEEIERWQGEHVGR